MQENRIILIVGFGAIAKCLLKLLAKKTIPIEFSKITIIDSEDKKDELNEFVVQGARFFREELNPKEYSTQLLRYVRSGDLIIDLSCNIDTVKMVSFCQKLDILYLNSSIECWASNSKNLSIYERYMNLLKLKSLMHPNSATAVIEQGMNPGLVSQFAKIALLDLCNQYFLPQKKFNYLKKPIERAIIEQNFAKLANLTEVKTIHISERDSQTMFTSGKALRKQENTYYNTWSVIGLMDEMNAPAEIGWGTHENIMPYGAELFSKGPQNQIRLAYPALKNLVKSWVPSGEFIGMTARHGETFTISNFLTETINDIPIYRPSVYFCYLPCELALESLRNQKPETTFTSQRILKTELKNGADEVGCLLLGPLFKGWWTGSILDISEARRIEPSQNATILQVVAGLASGLSWILNNPNKGICVPECLPHEEILNFAKPYLGNFVSRRVDWAFLNNVKNYQYYDFASDQEHLVDNSIKASKTISTIQSYALT